MAKLSDKDKKEILRLRSLFPRSIKVITRRSEDGGFVAEISKFRGCVTEAETFSELIEMVNDAIYTLFEVPEKFISYMPSYTPPLEVVRRLSIFPVRRIEENITLNLPSTLREKVGC